MKSRFLFSTGLLATFAVTGACQSRDEAPESVTSQASANVSTGVFHAKGTLLRALDVIPSGNLAPAERVLVATLQGLAAKSSPEQIYIDEGGPSTTWKDFVSAKNGVALNDYSTWGALLSRFQTLGKVSGYVLYDRAHNSRSLTAATSLCGPMNAIAVDASLEARVRALGITTLKADVRALDERSVYATYGSSFTKRIAAELSPAIDYHLRDYITMTNAFTFYDGNTSWRTSVLQGLDSEAFCLGYGQDEFNMVADSSSQGVTMLPSDLAPNLAPLSSVYDTSGLTQATYASPVTEDNVHYVTFLTSDGDNVAFDLWSLANYFGDANRGTFDMGYTISPSLVDLAPSVMRWYYENASKGAHKDFFVAGPSGSGYMFPSRMPAADLDTYLNRLSTFMGAANLNVCNILDQGAFGRTDLWNKYLSRANIDGLLYTGYGETAQGRISFSANGKPVIESRDNLWAGLEEESTVVANINSRPANPRVAQGYTFVFVHAWTKSLSNIRNVISQLHSNVRVVTPDAFVKLVQQNLGGGARPIADGTYKLINLGSGKALDVAGVSSADGADVLQWSYAGASNQRWVFSYQADGYYKVTALHSGMALDVAGLSVADGGDVIQWSWNGGENQLWRVFGNGDGTYRLMNKHSGKALEVYGASSANGANVDQWSWGNAVNQKWSIQAP